MGPPSPVQAIPRSSHVLDSPHKRRKTNESTPPLARSNSDQFGSSTSTFSLAHQSPNFPFPGPRSQGLDRPLSSQGSIHESTHSLDFVSLSDPTGLPEHDVLDGSTADNRQYSADNNSYNGATTGIGPPADTQYDLLSPRFWTQQSVWPHASLLEACLMRYFVENLAHWVSLRLSTPIRALG